MKPRALRAALWRSLLVLAAAAAGSLGCGGELECTVAGETRTFDSCSEITRAYNDLIKKSQEEKQPVSAAELDDLERCHQKHCD